VLIIAALTAVDYLGGPESPFPVFYAIPVVLGAWYSGHIVALCLALGLPLERFILEMWVWPPPASTDDLLLTTLIRISTYTLLGLSAFRLAEHERALERHLEQLQGLLPLCATCKSIKNANNEWESLETYLESRSGAEFSHGICPSCASRHFDQ
jgi:hypothetical protein